MALKVYYFVFSLFFGIALFLFWTGYHNVDLAYNIKTGGVDFNSFKYQTPDQLYISGLNSMQYSFVVFFLLSCFSLLKWKL